MSSHRLLVRFTPVAVTAVLVPLLLFAFDAAAGTQRARNGTTFTVPYTTGSGFESSIPMFEVKQAGGGIAGRFEITNSNSAAIALDGVNSGTGHALLAWNLGLGRGAVIITSNSQNTLPALDTSSQSLGIPASQFSQGLAAAADIRANNTQSTAPAVQLSTLGQSTVLNVNHRGPTGRLGTFQTAGKNQIFLNRDGSGYFSSEVRAGNHGVTEAIVPEGLISSYQLGDVLSVSTANNERVTKSSGAYSRQVIGVNADPAGIVLSNQPADASLRSRLKVGMLGLFPVKVNVSNGAIKRGDILVTSGTAGVAMRATDFRAGAMLGKAMGEWLGPGQGTVLAMISLQ
jgi:hypothetical protein